jgi:photosystem II stability/assembly factor-like uncharacterized protein
MGLVVLVLCTGCGFLPSLEFNPWEVLQLPTKSTALDISFITPKHGWLVGTNATLMETFDGGRTWIPRTLDLDSPDYRLASVSFAGQEGWIAGEPSLLLHTTNGGQAWERITLSAKLPGAPNTVFALGNGQAELTTDIAAIYKTEDQGKTWQALVQEAVGVVRNISRSPDGQYVAVSSRGSFYSTWSPGQPAWEPHNRTSSRRVQNMGFGENGQLWMLINGGNLSFSEGRDWESWSKPVNPQVSVSVGLLDLAYRTPKELWLAGGSGNLLCSTDGGQTWKKDRDISDVASNLYKIRFFGPNQGFILGQQGILLRYASELQAQATPMIPVS